MYHPTIIARAQARLEQVYHESLPKGLIRYPVDVCAAMAQRFGNAIDPATNQPLRRLTPEEDQFIANEQLLTKIDFRYWAERYAWVNAEGQGLKRLFPLWESQTLVLDRMATLQWERAESGHPDGLLINVLKARQLGVSTLGAALGTHRVSTHTHVRAILASDVPDNSGSEGLFGMYERLLSFLPWYLKPAEKFHTKNQHVIFENGSALLVESGKSMKGGLQDEGGQKGNLGRSKTFSVVHLTELSTWERPEQIDDGLMPAVPRTARTLGMEESTAKGRHNWHHEDWLAAVHGRSRFTPIFIPWYAEPSKYWLPAPITWSPDEATRAHAQKVELEGPKWLHHPVSLSREQLCWYEQTRLLYTEKGRLAKFLEEYAADPEECFQHSGRSIFGIEQLQYLDRLARPPIDVWAVNPARDLADIRASELEQIRLAKALAATLAEGPQAPRDAFEGRELREDPPRVPLGVSSPPRISLAPRPPAPEVREDSFSLPSGYGFRRLTVEELRLRQDLLGTLAIYEHPHQRWLKDETPRGWHEDPRRGPRQYVLGVDVADGIGKDRAVIKVHRIGTIEEVEEQVACYASDLVTPVQLAYVVDAIGRLYCDADNFEALAAIECNNHGLSTQDTLQLHLGYANFYKWEYLDSGDPRKRYSTKIGWMTTDRTRPILLDKLYEALTTIDPVTKCTNLLIHSAMLRAELADFQTEGALWEAEAARGAHDDHVMACAIAHYVAWRLQGGEQEPLSERRTRMHREQEARRLAAAPLHMVPDWRNTGVTLDEMKAEVEDGGDEEVYDERHSPIFLP